MDEEIRISKKLLKILSEDTRVEILKLLGQRQMTASEISRALDKHVTTVTEHLNVLQTNSLVQRIERPGRKWIYYKLTRDAENILHPTFYTRSIILLSLVIGIVIAADLLVMYQSNISMHTAPPAYVDQVKQQVTLALDQQLQSSTVAISNQDIANTLNAPS